MGLESLTLSARVTKLSLVKHVITNVISLPHAKQCNKCTDCPYCIFLKYQIAVNGQKLFMNSF